MSENGPERTRPFILVTGTPGTGKTTTASLIAVRTNKAAFLTDWFFGRVGKTYREM
jgi:adenylate kinase family enzyme